MRILLLLLCLCGFGNMSYADDSQSDPQKAGQMQLQKLIDIDKQIENLEEAKLKHKADMAKDVEHGSFGVLPRTGRRESRQAGQEMKEIKELNQQIIQLESKRQSIILSLQ